MSLYPSEIWMLGVCSVAIAYFFGIKIGHKLGYNRAVLDGYQALVKQAALETRKDG